jgi:HrpA-like RNA helicase
LENSKNLPIAEYRAQIVAAVRENSAVIITAETGAGKSTQVPQFLLDEGYAIVVTEPRRLAARTVAMRVAQERGENLGEIVGFRTAYERQDSEKTRCLFCTDGLALVRELMGHGQHTVLVLDEVHEWNINIEVLLAWAKRQIQAGASFKVVVMSATLESEQMSAYFDGAPVIEVPGRLHPVTERRAGYDVIADVESLVREGRNVLVFQPGKAEIAKTISDLTAIDDLSAEILSLHGELDPAEQNKCFAHYHRPKVVVATNVAQTSITIDDIDAVVDTGMERRVELFDGVEGLYLKPISLADGEQRKGRAGRTKPGVYIDHCPEAVRPRFPVAEILRSRLDQTVLRLAEAGIDAEELEFFHQPEREEIHEARRALKSLGCLNADGNVTRIGRLVAKLPVSVQYARMIVEAEHLGVVDDVIDVAAILEQGEVTARRIKRPDGREVDAATIWRSKFCPDEKTSDVMAQLVVFQGARGMNNDELRESGIFVKAYRQAQQKRKHLGESLRNKVRFGSTGNREDILRAICAGMVDHLFQSKGYGEYQNGGKGLRKLNRETVIYSRPDWLVGLPWDLEIKTRYGGKMTLNLIRMATKVDPIWLVEVAPQLSRIERGFAPQYNPEKDCCTSITRVFFNDQLVKEEREDDPRHPDSARIFREWLAGQMLATLPY